MNSAMKAVVDERIAELEAELAEARRTYRCFHCGFVTSDKAEAEAHFGERDDPEEFSPLCKWWQRIDDGERANQYASITLELERTRADEHVARTQLAELYAVINTDGSLTTHEEHIDLARDGAAALARLPVIDRLAVDRLLNVARGCHDYGGGYRDAEYGIFQHGISTVVRALERAVSASNDPQVNMLELIGKQAAIDDIKEKET